MGKTRGHGTRRGGSKGRPRGKGRGEEDESGSEEEEFEVQRGLGACRGLPKASMHQIRAIRDCLCCVCSHVAARRPAHGHPRRA